MKNFDLVIGDYNWKVCFLDKNDEIIKGCDGRTLYNDFKLVVRNDLNKEITLLVIMHEITHALFGTQGRVYQKTFNVEEVCEFVAYRFKELKSLYEKIKANLDEALQ